MTIIMNLYFSVWIIQQKYGMMSFRKNCSRKIWEDVLNRLQGAFIQNIEKNRKREIGVINPSVNDFLREYLQKNDIERENIQKNATEYEQIKRGFSESMEDIIKAGKANLYNYTSPNEEMYVILTHICSLNVFHDNYKYVVERFFQTLPYDSFEGMMGRCELFIRLLSSKFDAFYHTYDYLDEGVLIEFFWNLDLRDFQGFIESAEKYGIDFFYTEYRDVLLETIQAAIYAYMEDVEGYIEGYLEPSEREYDHHERDYDYGISGEMDVLDCIFK